MPDSENFDAADRPWLLDLATKQRGRSHPASDVVYDEHAQMSYLKESFVPVIDTDHRTVTKKADVEVGEDQKR